MACYRDGGCGPYEMSSCGECPYSKPQRSIDMTREELLAAAKPILFNTDMVRAILDGTKSVTRRVVSHKAAKDVLCSPARLTIPDLPDERFIYCLCNAPYTKSDILYVRETWRPVNNKNPLTAIDYLANWSSEHLENSKSPLACNGGKWRPSIHMPKSAARIFLRVTGVRVEGVQDITAEQIRKEGLTSMAVHCGDMKIALKEWELLWDSTIKKSGLEKYGWEANPWVWVVEFERMAEDERN